ncbi:MAG: SAF domain-containing protein [Hyphomonadaceae bacterium]|nr:SAF domain-containing protein [Hyphomonadaceae bacterium]
MFIVDTALAKRAASGKAVRFGMVGAGFQAFGTALQTIRSKPGLELSAIAARNPDQALRCFREAGVDDVAVCNTVGAISDRIRAGKAVVTEDPEALARADGLEAVVEVTGSMDFALSAILAAIESGKHVVQMNAELDGTVGPLLKVKADKAGVIYTFSDGDQPGVEMNLYRFVKGIGVKPVLCGNIKGLQDPYRTPATQRAFAEKWGQNPYMVTSFADGTKISFEQAIVANGTGMRVARRGMIGPDFSGGDPTAPLTPLDKTLAAFADHLDPDGPGIVDYVVGASPGPGVFVLGTHDDPRQKHYLNLYKLGAGPYYVFYTPYHLCHFELPNSVARAVLFGDAVLAPAGAPQVGVAAVAKKDIAAGELLDGFGGYALYGVAENADVIAREDLLPIGLAEGARATRAIAKDTPLTFADVARPAGRTIDRLYAEQSAHFGLDNALVEQVG